MALINHRNMLTCVCSISCGIYEKSYRKVSLQASHYSLVIANDRGYPTLNKYNILEFHIKTFLKNDLGFFSWQLK